MASQTFDNSRLLSQRKSCYKLVTTINSSECTYRRDALSTLLKQRLSIRIVIVSPNIQECLITLQRSGKKAASEGMYQLMWACIEKKKARMIKRTSSISHHNYNSYFNGLSVHDTPGSKQGSKQRRNNYEFTEAQQRRQAGSVHGRHRPPLQS